jgi:hypothetical protein
LGVQNTDPNYTTSQRKFIHRNETKRVINRKCMNMSELQKEGESGRWKRNKTENGLKKMKKENLEAKLY